MFCVFVQLSVGSGVRTEVCAKDQTLAPVQMAGWADFARSVSSLTFPNDSSLLLKATFMIIVNRLS